jgi:hypothetical protein
MHDEPIAAPDTFVFPNVARRHKKTTPGDLPGVAS